MRQTERLYKVVGVGKGSKVGVRYYAHIVAQDLQQAIDKWQGIYTDRDRELVEVIEVPTEEVWT